MITKYKDAVITLEFANIMAELWATDTKYTNYDNIQQSCNALFSHIMSRFEELFESLSNALGRTDNSIQNTSTDPLIKDLVNQAIQMKSAVFDWFGFMTTSINTHFIEKNKQCMGDSNTAYNNLLSFPLYSISTTFKNNNSQQYKNIITIDDCFSYYLYPSYWTGENKNYCVFYPYLLDSISQQFIDYTPNLLLIILERTKNKAVTIKIPDAIDLKNCVYLGKDDSKYFLSGFSCSYGKYNKQVITFTRNEPTSSWYKYESGKINKVDNNEVQTILEGKSNSILPNTLLYTKISNYDNINFYTVTPNVIIINKYKNIIYSPIYSNYLNGLTGNTPNTNSNNYNSINYNNMNYNNSNSNYTSNYNITNNNMNYNSHNYNANYNINSHYDNSVNYNNNNMNNNIGYFNNNYNINNVSNNYTNNINSM